MAYILENDDDDAEVFSSICPYTGLITYTRPEWTDAIFGTDYSLSLTIIGNRILAVKIKGYSTLDVVTESTNFTKEVIGHYFGKEKEFFYIGDFTGVTGVTKDARRYYVNYLNSLTEIKAFILCSPSPFMKLASTLSMRFNIIKYRVRVEKNYSDAVKQAVWMANQDPATTCDGEGLFETPHYASRKTLHSPGGWNVKRMIHAAFPFLAENKKTPVSLTGFTREEWQHEFKGYSARFELINGNIIHKITKGYISEDFVNSMYQIQGQLFKSCGLSSHPYYLVNGVKELQGSSLKARKKYSRLFSLWLEEYPNLNQVIVYGANRLLRAALSIAVYNKPFSIVFANDFQEAMEIIQQNRETKPNQRSGFPSKKRRRKDDVTHYAHELNCFLGDINWEVESPGDLIEEKPEDHPFKAVYDAIALIKADIDELFRDREIAQVALQESEEVSRALLNATHDLSMLIQSDGTIISTNQPFATVLRQEQKGLKGKKLAEFLPQHVVDIGLSHAEGVVDTGEPALFEAKLSGRYYQNTIYPVFSADKKVDRLALYSRDITGLKQAQEQIHGLTQELLKAQENERRRIARDLHDNVAQDLASLIISNDSLFEDYETIPSEVRQRNKKFSGVLKKTIDSIRGLVYDLRPPGLMQLGLTKTMDKYCDDFSKKTGIEIDLYAAGLERIFLDGDTRINLFRILQEALNNANKHAKADRISVRLIASHPDLILRIEDNGCGFDPEVRMVTALQEKRMGLKSMEERVNLLTGELTIRSRKGAGTRIVVKFPYRQYILGHDKALPPAAR